MFEHLMKFWTGFCDLFKFSFTFGESLTPLVTNKNGEGGQNADLF